MKLFVRAFTTLLQVAALWVGGLIGAILGWYIAASISGVVTLLQHRPWKMEDHLPAIYFLGGAGALLGGWGCGACGLKLATLCKKLLLRVAR